MGWLKDISYGYHEVKLYLATQAFDHARHVEAFRKRALANGGGLGRAGAGLLQPRRVRVVQVHGARRRT